MNFLFFGELMLRLTSAREGERLAFADILRITPGGSEANSAVAIKALGDHKVTFLSAFPDNPLGEKCLRALKAFGVNVIPLPSQSKRIGLYWLDIGKGPRSSNVYYDRDNSAFDMIDPETILSEHLECDWFHSSGITPAISERTCKALFRCIEFLPPNVPFSLDLNFRSKLWQWAEEKKMRAIYDKLSHRAVLLSGNESDFQTCFGLKPAGKTMEDIYSSIANVVFSRYHGLRFLAVNLRTSHSATRNSWSGMLFVRDGSSYKKFISQVIEIDTIIDRLGTGDSFTAGILHGLTSFADDYKRTLDFAIMLSALKHSIFGDFSCFSEEDVNKALQTLGSGQIER
ncbi:MAG: sugar kinase [Desulfobacterales bacterium]|nr:sugar kinase [Desulfobacterales bacterium]